MSFCIPPAYLVLVRLWPPSPGLLGEYSRLALTPREQWGIAEWRDYAAFLEESGRSLKSDLERTEQRLNEARRKLKRGNRQEAIFAPRTGTLLPGFNPPVTKRGRKPSDRLTIAAECLAIREQMELNGMQPTDRDAVSEYFKRKGLRSSRANAKEGRCVIQAMSRTRCRKIS